MKTAVLWFLGVFLMGMGIFHIVVFEQVTPGVVAAVCGLLILPAIVTPIQQTLGFTPYRIWVVAFIGLLGVFAGVYKKRNSNHPFNQAKVIESAKSKF